ncbi:MAG TPA: hypothetical protein VIO32_03595 [Candidatus Baltobacteraceae bacterium]
MPAQLGIAVYRAAARVAQPPFVDGMLARAALDRGDLAHAQRYAQRLPASAKRDDLLAEIAQARGDDAAAQHYFVRAGDIEAIDRAVSALRMHDPQKAYGLESALKDRLAQSGTHPDAVAEAYWRLGRIAWQESKRELGMQQYMQAIALSPLSEKYLISGGFAAYDLHDDDAALRYFARALSVDPASADADAGAGMALLAQGDRAGAVRYEQRARSANPRSHALHTLDRQLSE